MAFKTPKILVLTTSLILFLMSLIVVQAHQEELPSAIEITTEGQPTLGYKKAPVHVVIFEEPKCPDCKNYNNTVFPSIKKEFIDTNKIVYTVIPVSFLSNSMPAAIALLCVYHQDAEYPNRDLFFTYLDYMYRHQPPEDTDWATDSTLKKFAKAASPAISLEELSNCIDKQGHRIQIEKNTQYGSKLMTDGLGTPTIYVDGIKLEEETYSHVSKVIKSALRRKGV